MIELSSSEKIAYRMIMAVPEVSSKLVRKDGFLDLKEIHNYMHSLVRSLEIEEAKRKNTFIDIDPIELAR